VRDACGVGDRAVTKNKFRIRLQARKTMEADEERLALARNRCTCIVLTAGLVLAGLALGVWYAASELLTA
jgi:hypothetical protein